MQGFKSLEGCMQVHVGREHVSGGDLTALTSILKPVGRSNMEHCCTVSSLLPMIVEADNVVSMFASLPHLCEMSTIRYVILYWSTVLQSHHKGLHLNGLSQFFSFHLILSNCFRHLNHEEILYENSLISQPSPFHKHVFASW